MKVFFLRLGMLRMIQGWPLFPLLFKNTLVILATEVEQNQSIDQSINYIAMEKVKMSLFTDGIVICIYNSKEPISSENM